MSKLIYYKANHNRMPEFQTKLKIIEEQGVRRVMKAPLTMQAKQHIQRTYQNSQRLSALSDHFDLHYEMKGDALCCDFVEGTALSQKFVRFLDYYDEKDFHTLISWFQKEVYTLLPDAAFQKDEKMKEIFGIEEEMQHMAYCALANLDFNFDNIILTAEGYKVIDAEWVFSMTLPKDYIIYRSFLYLMTKYKTKLSRYCSFKDVLDFLSITPEQAHIYHQMEQSFQKYVYGEETQKDYFYEWCEHNEHHTKKVFHPQLYYSCDMQLCEDNNVMQTAVLDGKAVHLSFEVDLKEVSLLRIDPIDFPACIKLKNISIETEFGVFQPDLTSLDHNAMIVQNDFYVFPHHDAQYRIMLDKKMNIKKVEIDFLIEDYDNRHDHRFAKMMMLYQEDRDQLQHELKEAMAKRDEYKHLLFLANASLEHYRHPVRTICSKLKSKIIRR